MIFSDLSYRIASRNMNRQHQAFNGDEGWPSQKGGELIIAEILFNLEPSTAIRPHGSEKHVGRVDMYKTRYEKGVKPYWTNLFIPPAIFVLQL